MRRRGTRGNEMMALGQRWPRKLLAEAQKVADDFGIERAEAMRVGLAVGLRHLTAGPAAVATDPPAEEELGNGPSKE